MTNAHRYKVTVRTDADFVVEAETEEAARKQVLDDIEDTSRLLCPHDWRRSVVEVKNLADPSCLIAELVMHLEALIFQNKYEICRFCGGPRAKHAADCIIELARYYLMERES